MQTNPDMNSKIVGILRTSDAPHCLYAAQRIEELETVVEAVQKYAIHKAMAEKPIAEQWAAYEAQWQKVVRQVEALAAEAAKETQDDPRTE